jgi:hypothetical protein
MASETEPRHPTEAERVAALAAKRAWHASQAALPPRAKVERLLRLQREILPILRRRRALLPHERPWPIEP